MIFAMTHTIEAPLMPMVEFREQHLLALGAGAVGLHVMTYDGIYPTAEDQADHTKLMVANLYGDPEAGNRLRDEVAQGFAATGERVRASVAVGGKLLRLRALPDLGTSSTEVVQAMVDHTKPLAEAGEKVRFFDFNRQVGRLAGLFTDLYMAGQPETAKGLGHLHYTLRQKQPGGLWALYEPRLEEADGDEAPQFTTVGLMTYDKNGQLPGIEIHSKPSDPLLAYANFWAGVFASDKHSAPSGDWQRLATEDNR
jgi:hypothetical protein